MPIKEILAIILTTACSALEQGFDTGQRHTSSVLAMRTFKEMYPCDGILENCSLCILSHGFCQLPVQLSKTSVKGPVRQVMSCAPKQICYNPDGRTFPISNPLSRWRLLFQGDCSCIPELGHHSKKLSSVMGMGTKALGICLAKKTLRDRVRREGSGQGCQGSLCENYK